jgi:hypothetical protein
MNVKDKGKNPVIGLLIRLSMVVIILAGVSIGLGYFTAYLADVSYASPDKSIKEFISGLGVLGFGFLTFISSAGTLGAFAFLLFGFFNPEALEDK